MNIRGEQKLSKGQLYATENRATIVPTESKKAKSKKEAYMTLEWHHPALDGGEVVGITNVGTQVFRDLEQFYKEMGQNTRDAHNGLAAPATIVFKRERIKIAEVPGLREVLERLEMCKESWSHCPTACEFFDRGISTLQSRKGVVDCLRVSDYNTRGVPGNEADKNSPWYKLARSTGSTGKKSGEGGSHGVGKIAALAASQVRTVYYSTLAEDGGRRFLGTSLLTTYSDEKGIERQPRSFFGDKGGKTIVDSRRIPESLRREEIGLDILIPAFKFKRNWMDHAMASVVKFFWPAISQGVFEAIVVEDDKEDRVNKENLHEVLQRHRGSTDAHLHHRIYSDAKKRHDFDTALLKKCSVFVSVGEDLNNKFVMIRKNGIVIEDRLFRSRLRVSGVFECTNEIGNELLRRMEPPCHDEWDPKWMDEDEDLGKKAEGEVRRCIREAIEKVTLPSGAETGSVTGLENLLPMEGDVGSPGAKQGAAQKKPKRTYSIQPISRKVIVTRNRTKKAIKITPLAARAVNASKGKYSLKIDHPQGMEKAHIAIGIAGDSDEAGFASIRSAEDASGKKKKISKDRLSFGPVSLERGTSSFDVQIDVKRRVSLKVYARHEN